LDHGSLRPACVARGRATQADPAGGAGARRDGNAGLAAAAHHLALPGGEARARPGRGPRVLGGQPEVARRSRVGQLRTARRSRRRAAAARHPRACALRRHGLVPGRGAAVAGGGCGGIAMSALQRLDWRQVPLEGRVLIEASAGTGKTWTIAQLYLRLLLEHGADVGAILVCTFSEAAAQELRERLRARLRDAERLLATWPAEPGRAAVDTALH